MTHQGGFSPLVWYLIISDVKHLLKLLLILYVLFCVVVKNGHYCSLLEVTDRNRSATSVKKLLQELEIKRVVSSARLD